MVMFEGVSARWHVETMHMDLRCCCCCQGVQLIQATRSRSIRGVWRALPVGELLGCRCDRFRSLKMNAKSGGTRFCADGRGPACGVYVYAYKTLREALTGGACVLPCGEFARTRRGRPARGVLTIVDKRANLLLLLLLLRRTVVTWAHRT
jgi:hypothetical protein